MPNFVDLRSPPQDAVAIEDGTPRPRKKKFKGWDGEASGMQAIAPLCSTDGTTQPPLLLLLKADL
jgi:hypothetical protein